MTKFFTSSNASRTGFTVSEIVVASVLLAVAMATTSSFHQRVLSSRHAIEQASLVNSLIANARSEVASWPQESVSQQRIEQLPLSQKSQAALPQARWLAEVSDLEQPTRCKQVFIGIQWQARGQTQTSAGMTFWLKRDGT